MESNPCQSTSPRATQTPASQVIPSVGSSLAQIIVSWIPFGMVMFLFLPSLHELPKADLGRLVFQFGVIIISMRIGFFVTVKHLDILAKRLASRTRPTETTTSDRYAFDE